MSARRVIDRRELLAPLVGERVPVRAVAMRGGRRWTGSRWVPTTFLARVDADLGRGWERVAGHAWLHDADLAAECGAGVVVEFTAEVRVYETKDPETGRMLTRYGLRRPDDVRPVGPQEMREMVREMIECFGFDAVADVVAELYPGGGGTDDGG